MNELLQKSFNTLTMSSREIATLCDKRHSDVKRDIEVLTEQLDVDVRKFAHIYLDSMNRQQTEYLLDKDTCLCLVAGYNAKLRMAIIKRWQELEQANTPTDPLLMIAHMAQQAYETKILAQQVAHRQDSIEHTVKEIQAKQEALTDSSNFFSVLAFANLHEIGLTNGKLSALSKKAGKYSEKLGMAVGTISDPRWGRVKTYHKDVLTELFELESLI